MKSIVNNFVDRKNQIIFNSYDEFLDNLNISDGVCALFITELESKENEIVKLTKRLKKINTHLYIHTIEDYSITSSNIMSICDFMKEKRVDSIIAIGEDFLGELIKGVSLYYNNPEMCSVKDFFENENSLKYDNLREIIFIPTTGGGNETHRYFRILDDTNCNLYIMENNRVVPDKIVVDEIFFKNTKSYIMMYHAFSIILNCVDVIFLDGVSDEVKNVCKDILVNMTELLKNGEKFSDSRLFRNKFLECSLKSSDLIDKNGYGVMYFYGGLIEGLFSIERNTVDCLTLEFFLDLIKNDDRFYIIREYFYNIEVETNINSIFTYDRFINAIKKKYGARDNISIVFDEKILDSIKVVCYDMFKSLGIASRYKDFVFDKELNDKLFDYYINGIVLNL